MPVKENGVYKYVPSEHLSQVIARSARSALATIEHHQLACCVVLHDTECAMCRGRDGTETHSVVV